MAKSGRIAVVSHECVACGVCARVCPRGALSVFRGIRARVDHDKCVGCGICASACPACVISIKERAPRAECAASREGIA